MNPTTQASERKDGFGTEGLGEDGDGSMGEAGSAAGATGADVTGGQQNGGRPVEGAFGKDEAHGRRSPANKQGLEGGGTAQD